MSAVCAICLGPCEGGLYGWGWHKTCADSDRPPAKNCCYVCGEQFFDLSRPEWRCPCGALLRAADLIGADEETLWAKQRAER